MDVQYEEKEQILQYLQEMFCHLSHQEIRNVCEQQSWNVNNCMYMLGNNFGNNMQPTVSTFPKKENLSKQQFQHGAFPKYQQKFPIASGNKTDRNYKSHMDSSADTEQKVVESIQSGAKIMVLMRGVPGSGKTTLAKSVVTKGLTLDKYKFDDFVFSADDYFYDAFGRYRWSPDRLDDAHNFNQMRVQQKALAGWSPIIVDNTNIHLWHMMPYVQIAVRNGYLVEILEPKTPWANSAGKLALKNSHGVTRERIQLMLNKYESATVNDLFKMLKTTWYTVPIPQMRNQPPLMWKEENNLEEKDCVEALALGASKMNIECDKEMASITSKQLYGDILNNPKDEEHVNKSNERNTTKIESNQTTNSLGGADNSLVGALTTYSWKPFEENAGQFWGFLPQPQRKTAEGTNVAQVKDNIINCLRQEVFKEDGAVKNVSNENEVNETQISTFQRHSVNCTKENKTFISLRQIYPNKQVSGLWDLFVKCQGDLDWTVEILLKEDEFDVGRIKSVDFEAEAADDYQCACITGITPEEVNFTTVTESASVGVSSKPQRQRSKAQRNNGLKNDFQDMKETIENSIEIKEEFYSEGVRKVREQRNKTNNTLKTKVNIETQTSSIDDDQDETEVETELVEVSLNENLIENLTEIFCDEVALGEPLIDIQTITPKVFMPRSLAKEIYMLWLESVYNQMEEQRNQTIQDDEQFAMLLKNPKYDHIMETPSNLRELLDMEMAWMIYNTEKEKIMQDAHKEKPPDLAAHLSQMKLFEKFPNIPQETLLDILAAHNNNYSETVEVLRSTMETEPETLTRTELMERALRENELLNSESESQEANLKENHKRASSSINGGGSSTESNPKTEQQAEEAKRMALHDFEQTRNMASHHNHMKAECYQKARVAIQSGNRGVAIYYSQIADLHKKKIDMYNHMAANCIMNVHKYTQNNPEHLDLHYLHVLEALACLDIFLDEHITSLRAQSRCYKHVFVITGRGLHSVGGISAIKNNVKKRLKERYLRWSEVNPGLLKVKVYGASRHSKNINF